MTQKMLSVTAKTVIILFGVLGLAFYGLAVPVFGLETAADYPELSYLFLPWLIFIELMAVPDYTVLVYAWKIASSFSGGNAFRQKNADRFKIISRISLYTSIYFLAGNLVLFFLNMNHPSVLLVSLALVFIGVSVSAASAILSYYTARASRLQEESELTI